MDISGGIESSAPTFKPIEVLASSTPIRNNDVGSLGNNNIEDIHRVPPLMDVDVCRPEADNYNGADLKKYRDTVTEEKTVDPASKCGCTQQMVEESRDSHNNIRSKKTHPCACSCNADSEVSPSEQNADLQCTSNTTDQEEFCDISDIDIASENPPSQVKTNVNQSKVTQTASSSHPPHHSSPATSSSSSSSASTMSTIEKRGVSPDGPSRTESEVTNSEAEAGSFRTAVGDTETTNTGVISASERVTAPILGYEIMEQRARFTVFKLQVQKGDLDSWFIFRRYSDFHRLNEQLRLLFPRFRLSLPPKKWFGDNFDRDFIEDRMLGLQAFVNNVLGHPDIVLNPHVKEFFCLDTPPGPHDSMEESRALCEHLEDQVYHLKKEVRDRDNKIHHLQEEVALHKLEIENLRKALRQNQSHSTSQSSSTVSLRGECTHYSIAHPTQPHLDHVINSAILHFIERSLNISSTASGTSPSKSENSLPEGDRATSSANTSASTAAEADQHCSLTASSDLEKSADTVVLCKPEPAVKGDHLPQPLTAS